MSLPTPSRARWQPLRSGLVDLYRYDEQEFWFEDGRLLLRGNNGTGKSRVMALQLPFLLDGEISPHRLEPDGDPAKRAEWNLLMNRYERRLGYTWLELGRLGDDGVARYLTLGCGMQAVKGRGGPTRWFFLTPRRVGEDLSLVESRVALSRERLRAAIGPDGELHDTVDGWRQCVDRALFRLGPRYRPLLDLLIQLRQPQLSRDLDEGRLSRALSLALRPLSPNVVEPLAEAFRALETDRAELDGLRDASVAAEEFLSRYRSYAGVATRRRAARLRSAHAGYEAASRASLRANERRAAAREALTGATAEVEQARRREEDARTRLSTLEAAPAMDRARELDRAEDRLKRVAAEAGRADGALATAVERQQQRGRTAQERQEVAGRAREEAGSTGQKLEQVAALVGLDVATDRPGWDRALGARRAAVSALEQQERRLSEAELATQRASRTTEDRRAELDSAREAEVGARRAAELAGQALLDALAAWSPTRITLDHPALLAAVEDWLADPRGRGPLEAAVAEAGRQAVAAVEKEKAALDLERQQRRAERTEARAEIQRLRSGGHAPPAAWPTRRREASSPGVPLWRLCDFAEEVSEATRAGLEAALEAAGLLDALVTPDGALLPDGALDAALTLRSPPVEPSLASRLSPLPHPEIPPEVVAGVLARIGLGEGPVWVDDQGCYALGPLRGAWRKAQAEHIGETAREAARRRRVAELELEVQRLDGLIAALGQRLTEEEARLQAIRAEVAGQPDDAPVRDAALAAARAGAERDRAQRRLVEAESVLLKRREEEASRRGERDELARDLGLGSWVGRPQELKAALYDADRAAADHYAAARRAADTQAAALAAEAALAEATTDRERAEATASEASRQHREARVTCETLRETHGAEVVEILAQITAAKAALQQSGLARRQAETALTAAVREDASSEAEASTAQARQQETEAERDASVSALLALVEADLLSVLNVPLSEPPTSPTRAVELARRLEERLAEVAMDDSAWARVRDNLHRDLEELRRALLEHRWDPVLHTVHDLYVVEVSLGDGPLRVPALRARLDEEVRARSQMLTERERQVIEEHLVGELAMELHDLIHQGERLVRDMSAEVESRATSTGMRLRFDWRLREDAGQAVREARGRLMRQGASWSTADRELLAQFLRERLDRERQIDSGATWQQQIERAFDYREWHSFVVQRHQDGQWQALTRRTHGTGSGGEKAIALTIPQLAAAAAYYKNADPLAPRLILLDEAFVGVDSDMRAKCMGLFATFDLDFMMTSEREWACYATLPGVAICQLVSAPGIDAVDVVRWVWNGVERRPA